MQAIYLTTDLFFSSRIVSLARQQGWDMHLVGNSSAVLQRATSAAPLQLLLIDLQHSNVNLAELISTLRPQHPQLRVIAYGPHVDEAMLENARQAGCDQVLSRGQFNQQASSLLQPI